MVIIWGDGVVNYIIVVIISRYTSNHHAVHLKPAQWYMSYVSVQAERQSRSKPSFAENHPSFSAFNHVLTERRLQYIFFTNKKYRWAFCGKGIFLEAPWELLIHDVSEHKMFWYHLVGILDFQWPGIHSTGPGPYVQPYSRPSRWQNHVASYGHCYQQYVIGRVLP